MLRANLVGLVVFVPRGVLAVSSPLYFFSLYCFVSIFVIIGKFFPLCPYVLAVICSCVPVTRKF